MKKFRTIIILLLITGMIGGMIKWFIADQGWTDSEAYRAMIVKSVSTGNNKRLKKAIERQRGRCTLAYIGGCILWSKQPNVQLLPIYLRFKGCLVKMSDIHLLRPVLAHRPN